MRVTIRLFLLVIILYDFSAAYQNAAIGIGGGYSGNLYADSFDVGNSYLVNKIALSSTHLKKTKLRLYYGLSYYEYDTNDGIDNFYHVPGIAVYDKSAGQKFKWGAGASAGIKDYTDTRSTLDNQRIFLSGDVSYYTAPGTMLKGQYRGTISNYDDYASLDNAEHWIETEIMLTFPTKTTMRITPRYAIRNFKEDSREFDWLDLELGASQSLDIRTGLSASLMKRWSGGGSRPLSSYFILSGITSYWDPWDGLQAELSIKRILPLAVVSKAEIGYWRRNFSYDSLLQENLWWLAGKSSRIDEGWSVKAGFSRQINLGALIGKAVAVTANAGYYSNHSSDRFYKYDFMFVDSNLEVRLF